MNFLETFLTDQMQLKFKILLIIVATLDEWNDSHRPLTNVTIRTRFITRAGLSTCVNVPSACLLNLCNCLHRGQLNKRCPKDSNLWFRLERTQHILTTIIPSNCYLNVLHHRNFAIDTVLPLSTWGVEPVLCDVIMTSKSEMHSWQSQQLLHCIQCGVKYLIIQEKYLSPMPIAGLEPTTCCLRNNCSTN